LMKKVNTEYIHETSIMHIVIIIRERDGYEQRKDLFFISFFFSSFYKKIQLCFFFQELRNDLFERDKKLKPFRFFYLIYFFCALIFKFHQAL
jgi:hypothetical protein